MEPSARLSALARMYQVMGSSSAQSATGMVCSVHSCAALFPTRSSSGVMVGSPVPEVLRRYLSV